MTAQATDAAPKVEDFTEAGEPFSLFETWFKDAKESEVNDPNAMAVATVDADGLPNVRMVLLNGLDGADAPNRGFVFFTNFESAKGRELIPDLEKFRDKSANGRY